MGVLVTLTAIFYLAPLGTGLDSIIFDQAMHRFLSGQSPYIPYGADHQGYFYPPWASLVIAPLTLLPERFTWAFTNAMSIASVAILGMYFKLGRVKTVLVMLSPAMIFNLWMGQIDGLFLLGILLPEEYWLLVASMKPQLLLGLAPLGLTARDKCLKTLFITLGIGGMSLVVWGLWPLEVLHLAQSQFATEQPQVFLQFLWPNQLIVGIGLLVVNLRLRDIRLALAASPFLARYASHGSYIGVVLALAASVKHYELFFILCVWWVVILLR